MAGHVRTWLALCSDTKLVPSWRIRDRSAAAALDFVADLKNPLAHRVQVTSDGNDAFWRPSKRRSGRTWTTRCW